MQRQKQTAKRGSDTRDRIISEAAKLFYLNGYRETTMRALASAVGIQHPSLFAFFENKGAIAAVLLKRYFRGMHCYSERLCLEINGQYDYIRNLLIFYALNYQTIYRDERLAAFYSAFCEEDGDRVNEITVSLKLLHESEYTEPSEPESEVGMMIHRLDYQLIGHIDRMLVKLLSERDINAREAALYFAAKKIEFKDTLWDVSLESVLDFYDRNWDRIAAEKIDVYRDLFSNESL